MTKPPAAVVIFGLGFTGARVARRLLARGVSVFAPVRGVARFTELRQAGVRLCELALDNPLAMGLPHNAPVVVTIPPLPDPENAGLRKAIVGIAPARIVYVSSTGVYGDQVDVDAATLPVPNDDRGRARLDEEIWMASGQWSSLILRAVAIYGPGRGVHAAVRAGKLPRGIGSGVVSRVHVDDLAALIEGGIFADIRGAWPVADEAPCSTEEIVRWCQRVWGLPPVEIISGNSIAGRKVDGTKIREILGMQLKYPSWQTGIAASLAEEQAREGG